jgi:UDP-3-O-[3-hydroxymyristoyl] glucosamine N-acyltransferase
MDSIKAKSQVKAADEVQGTSTKWERATGTPAWEYTPMLKAQALIKRLPEILERIIQLEKSKI